jgi:hypothetical protein
MLLNLKKIRKKLLDEGKLTKFIAYAFGEIIIVVIGILLALYLNNWNQNRADNRLEILYYQSIKNQLKQDSIILTGEMYYNQTYYSQFTYACDLIRSDVKKEIDTLGKIAFNMLRYSDFRRRSNIYQTLINSGEIKVLKNNNITEKLQSLEEIYLYINRLEENHSTIILSQIIPDIKETLQFDPIKVEQSEILFSYKFKNNFDILTGLMNEKLDAYKQAEDMIETIIGLIDKELTD